MKTTVRLLAVLFLLAISAASAKAQAFWVFGGTQSDLVTSSQGFQTRTTIFIDVIDVANNQYVPIVLGRNNNTGKNTFSAQGTQGLLLTRVLYNAAGSSYTVGTSVAAGATGQFAQFVKGNNAQYNLLGSTSTLAPTFLRGVAGVVTNNGSNFQSNSLIESTVSIFLNPSYTKFINDTTNTLNAAVGQVQNSLRMAGYVDATTGI